MSKNIDMSKPLSSEDRHYLFVRERHGEILANDLRHGKVREMTEEEQAEAEQKAFVESAGKRTPALMDNSMLEEQHKQRQADELAQLDTYADQTYADYDPDDVAYIQTLNDDELREKLKERELDTSGTRPEMQKRLLDSMTADSDGDPVAESQDGDNYDDESAWSFQDLRDEAKRRTLAANGSREELIARLRENNAAQHQS
jgi:hypothetical protein